MELTHLKPRLLVATPDPRLRDELQPFLAKEALDVQATDDGRRALSLISQLPPYDALLLDLTWPERRGFDVLREARRREVHSPVLAFTAADHHEDRLEAFHLGADDCVSKPTNRFEILARVRAVLRRSQTSATAALRTFRFGDVEVNFSDHAARRGSERVDLTTLETQILHYFIQHRGRTVTRSQLLRDVWGISGEITTRTIDRHVASLRKKIEPHPDVPDFIQTVYGIGYRFEQGALGEG